MIAKYLLALGLVFGLFACVPVQADDAADRAKLRDSLMEREIESWD